MPNIIFNTSYFVRTLFREFESGQVNTPPEWLSMAVESTRTLNNGSTVRQQQRHLIHTSGLDQSEIDLSQK